VLASSHWPRRGFLLGGRRCPGGETAIVVRVANEGAPGPPNKGYLDSSVKS
jgi:hypothetical protein